MVDGKNIKSPDESALSKLEGSFEMMTDSAMKKSVSQLELGSKTTAFERWSVPSRTTTLNLPSPLPSTKRCKHDFPSGMKSVLPSIILRFLHLLS